jgi:hypothetical protein
LGWLALAQKWIILEKAVQTAKYANHAKTERFGEKH